MEEEDEFAVSSLTASSIDGVAVGIDISDDKIGSTIDAGG